MKQVQHDRIFTTLQQFWIVLLIIGFLQGCKIFEHPRPITNQSINAIPKQWQASGRLGVMLAGQNQNAGFEITFNGQNHQLILIGTLGLGQITIVSHGQNLSINGNATQLSFKQWMETKIGWHFPVQNLGKIIFNQPFDNPMWSFKILSRQANGLAKTIRLTHRIKAIKIKLMVKNIDIIQKH